MTELTLDEFLLARIADDEFRELRQLAGGQPLTPEFERALRGTMYGRRVELRAKARPLAVAASSLFPVIGRRWRLREAAKYACHPDYRSEWPS